MKCRSKLRVNLDVSAFHFVPKENTSMRTNFPLSVRLAVCTALVLLLSQHAALGQNGGKDHAAKIQEVLALAHKYGQFNGAALVAENGKVVYKGAFGMANMEWGIPNAPDTKFRLGSITKQFTAMLTLQLVEQGKITSIRPA